MELRSLRRVQQLMRMLEIPHLGAIDLIHRKPGEEIELVGRRIALHPGEQDHILAF